jgi:replicative DNA helicase
MNIAYNVARTGKEVLVFSMEMSKEQLMDRLLSSVSGLPSEIIKSGKLVCDNWSQLTAGVAKLKDLKIHIIEIPAIDVNRALSIARKFAKKGNIGLVVVDYLQLMTANSDSRFDVVSDVSRKLKVMAKTIKAPVLALSQLSRKCEERSDKRPLMSDLRESGQIEQDADIVSFIYRDEYYNQDTPNKGTAEVITRKYRNGEVGTDIL